MKTRVLVAVILLPFFLAVLLLLPPIGTAFMVALMCMFAVWELLYATKLVCNFRILIYTMFMASAVVFWSYFGCQLKCLLLFLFVFFILLISDLLLSHAKLCFLAISFSIFTGFIIPV